MSDSPASQTAAELELLREAFERFMGAGESVSRAYDELRAKVDELNLQLEETNKELARNLAEKERLSLHLANVLGSLRSGILVVDDAGRVETANDAAARLFGGSAEDLEGREAGALMGLPIPAAGEREVEYRRGEETLTLRLGVHPMRKEGEGRPGHVLVVEDITAEARSRATAQRTDRLAAMGEMAVKIVHEVRNPMGSIELVASLLARDVAAEPDQAKMVDRIRSGIRTMNHTINNLLSFARNTQPSVRPMAVEEVMDLCLADHVHLLELQGVAVHRDYRGDAPVMGDPELLRQVFMNLILNAVQAMPAGGELRLETSGPGGEEAAAPVVRVRVTDTGEGMAPDVRSRVFHPFFTTKERGTGLGLALAHNIVLAHNGTIDVESEPGRGASFLVNLPADEARARAS